MIRPLLLSLGIVLGTHATAAAHEKGVIRLASPEVPRGGELVLTGERLPKGGELRLELRGSLDVYDLGRVRSDTAGIAKATLPLPDAAAPGSYVVIAFAEDGDEVARTDLAVLPAARAGTGHEGHVEPAGPAAPVQARPDMMALPSNTTRGGYALIAAVILGAAAAGFWLLRHSGGTVRA